MRPNRIRELREDRGLTTTELAYKVGATTDTVRRWEREYPPTQSMLKLAEFFDVSVDYLLGLDRKAA